jgi:pumilio family protein 6
VHDFVFKHDSVRVIQCAVKYSTIAQKKEIASELKGAYRQLAESRYAKFLLAKLITEGDEETKNMIIPEFYGHVRRLLNHPEASWILDDIYRSVAEPEQKARILRELYGPEFSVFTVEKSKDSKISADLPALLKAEPQKRKPILDFLHERINQLIQKKMTGFTILHDAMLQYFRSLSPDSEEFSAFIRLIIGDNKEEETDLLRNLAFTQSGSEIVCLALARSPAKDRRQILKAYKDVMEMLAYDQFGHRVLLTAFEVMDDTREITNRVFSEIFLLTKNATPEEQSEKIIALATSQIGHVALLYPYIGAERRLVPFRTLQLMQKVRSIRETTSKKDPAVRKTELMAVMQPLLLEAIKGHATELVASSYGSQLITEVIIEGPGEKAEALLPIAESVKGDPSGEGHISRTPFAGKMLKTLIAGGRYDRVSKKIIPLDPPLNFADLLFENIQPHLQEWIVGDGGFVVLALLEATWKDKSNAKVVSKAVRKNKTKLQTALKEGEETTDSDADAGDKRRRATAAKHLLQAIESK